MNDRLGGFDAILCANLVRKVDEQLIDLLQLLSAQEWDIQTIAPRWKVRDAAAHLLDTALRKLSLVRDSWFVENSHPCSPPEVIALVNRLNEEGVTVYRRLSPPVLIEMMSIACNQSAIFHESLDPFAPATFNVSWAGEDVSLNWFDTARELTERWHHQQQIRLATDRTGIMTPELYYPVLDCFVRGLPYAFRDSDAPTGTNVLLDVTGECGGQWVLSREANSWVFLSDIPKDITCKVTLPQSIAWRVFTKGIARDATLAQVQIEGNQDLAYGILGHTAIVG
ncbi:MAG: maleylpyruvate isomerase N-terminal domain-containing protein [Acidobacteriota bacterium]|nr:maleylpyruvate isomerase N-terminal domain-containing protein [Acidobacteriota bacterium]